MLVGLVLVDKIYLDLKCLLYKMASNFLQPGVFIIENNVLVLLKQLILHQKIFLVMAKGKRRE